MKYEFKPTPELGWFALTAIVGALAAGVASQGATPPTDWHAWGVGVASASARALLGMLLAMLTPKPA